MRGDRRIGSRRPTPCPLAADRRGLGPPCPAAGPVGLAEAAAQAQPLAHHGEIGNGRAVESRGSDRTSTARGETQSYLLRRLARDAPEILERVKAGEFKSARAAAIEAGIIRPVPTVRLVDDPQRVADAIRRHLSPEQIIKLAEALLA